MTANEILQYIAGRINQKKSLSKWLYLQSGKPGNPESGNEYQEAYDLEIEAGNLKDLLDELEKLVNP